MRITIGLFLVLALSACGVDSQRNAHVFDASEVPYGLADTTKQATTAAGLAPFTATTPTSVAFDLYFIRSGILVAVTRQAAVVPTPADLVTTLVAGPTPAEVSAGHRSALSGPDIVTQTSAAATTVTVDLAKTFNDIPRSDRIFALGQITLTLTSLPGVTLVRYTIADAPIEVPKANGVVTRDPVTRTDYANLLEPPNPSTSISNTPTTGASPQGSR